MHEVCTYVCMRPSDLIKARLQAVGETPKPSAPAADTARRLARLRALRVKLDQGHDVARRDLKNALTQEEWATYQSIDGIATAGAMGSRPPELGEYVKLLRKADLYDLRADSTPRTNRSVIDHLNRAGQGRLRAKAETTYETALEYLATLLDGSQGEIVRRWLDRPVRTDAGFEPSADRESVPRLITSRSQQAWARDLPTIFDRKRANKRIALDGAITSLVSNAPQ